MTPDWSRQGRAWSFGDHVSIEYISPLRYMLSPEGRGETCLKYLDAEFAAAQKQGDFIVAGKMFGHGPGHDHAILAIREAGIAGVIAKSFSPQFFRHAICHGLLVAQDPEILDRVSRGDELDLDFATGVGRNVTRGEDFRAEVPSGPARDILAEGGLVPYLKGRLAAGAHSVP